MGKINLLADALRTISNAERTGKKQVLIRPCSKIIIKFLQVMQTHGYIDKFTFIDDNRSGKIIVNLLGRINKCRAISPRYNIKLSDSEKWISNILPSRQFGIIVLSTSHGIISHKEASTKKTGGKILGFFY
jgi:small subunit ribosomal protein S15Ae